MKIFTGCDIVRIDRFLPLLSNTSFLDKCFTRHEQMYCFHKASPAQHFAARFAGKEAIIKALSGYRIRFGIGQIEIRNHESGKPYVEFHGNAVSPIPLPKTFSVDISLSHDGDYAMASALFYVIEEGT